jgi:hypothetical protein
MRKDNSAEMTAIKTIAINTNQPFWVAFKATMGIAMAQLVLTISLLASVAASGTGVSFVTK